MNKFLTLSFSGAGHLLPYHLGVATSLLKTSAATNQKKLLPIHAVSGSSSGAIAACLFVYFPNQIQDYTDRFISDGGRAMYHLKEMIYDNNDSNTSSVDNDTNKNNTSLHIATTRCSDGSLQLFDFPSKLQSSVLDKDHLVNCLRASCKIPPHFHPSDVLQKSTWLSSSYAIYPSQDGIIINGESHVDGGISAPAPPTPLDNEEGACRVVISPISGLDYNNESNTVIRISPKDNTWKLPIDIKCRGGFNIFSSIQNLKALQNSAGMVSSIQDWHERGIDDGERMVDSMTN